MSAVDGGGRLPSPARQSYTSAAGGGPTIQAWKPIHPASQQQSQPFRVGPDGELEKQLRAGIDLVQDAFDRRTASLVNEVARWKELASNQRQQIVGLETQSTQLARRVTELEKLAIQQKTEKQALLSARNDLMERYSALKKNASQLETFRKSIVNMVESGPATNMTLSDIDRSFTSSTFDVTHSRLGPDASPTRGSLDQLQMSIHEHPEQQQQQQQQQNRSMSVGKRSPVREQVIKNSVLEQSYMDDFPDEEGGRRNVAHLSFLKDQRQQSFELAQPTSMSVDYSISRVDAHQNRAQDFLTRFADTRDRNVMSSSHHQQHQTKSRQVSNTMNTTASNTNAPSILPTRKSPDRSQLPSRDEGATPTPATSNRLSHRQRSSSQSSASSPNLRSQSLQPQKQPHSHHHHSRHHHQIPQHSSQTQAKGQPQVKHPTVAHQQSTLSSPNPGIAAVDSPLISDNDGRVGVGSSSIDAPTLYKQIREGLSPGQFEEFASNVALFNSGQQTADQTVRNVGQIVKERRLFVQMRTLIYTALEESGDGAGTAPATSTGTPVSNAQSPNNAFAVAEEDGAKLDTPS